MKQRLVIFLVFAAVVFGVGFFVFRAFTGKESPERSDPEPAPVTEPVPKPEPTPEPKTEPEPAAKEVVVVSTAGRVERMGSGKKWEPVAPGDHMELDESIKTSGGATARLRVDEKSEIDLKERSQISVKEISDTVHRFELARGKIAVDYGPSGERVLKIENADSDAVAESRSGSFTILNANGQVAVATTAGEVKLTAKKETVTIPAGKSSRVVPGKTPLAAEPVPVAVLLKVANPEKELQRERFTMVTGRTDAGARVIVNDTPARVDEKGRFWARVPLRLGKNRLVVMSEDVAGNVKTRELPAVTVDPDAPIEDIHIKWKPRKENG